MRFSMQAIYFLFFIDIDIIKLISEYLCLQKFQMGPEIVIMSLNLFLNVNSCCENIRHLYKYTYIYIYIYIYKYTYIYIYISI